MTQQEKWITLVKQRLKEESWSQVDLAQVVGLKSPSAITELLKSGKGSNHLKLRVSKALSIREPWTDFEEKNEN